LKNKKHFGRPVKKKKNRSRISFGYRIKRGVGFKVAFMRKGKKRARVHVTKVGWITLGDVPEWISRRHVYFVTFKLEGTRWFATIHCDISKDEIKNEVDVNDTFENEYIGIDVGCNHLVATSHGDLLDLPDQSKRYKQIEELQRKKAATEDENHKIKLSRRIRNIHNKIKRSNEDRVKKIVSMLSRNNHTIFMENLTVGNFIGGTGAAARGKNRVISRAGMSKFMTRLEQTHTDRGGLITKVPPHYTSQSCGFCGHIEKQNRKGIIFKCLKCGHMNHADVNGAENIEMIGLAGGAGLTRTFTRTGSFHIRSGTKK